MIKLTLVNGNPVWISAQRIDMMVVEQEIDHKAKNPKEYNVTQIWIGGSDIPTQVKEPADKVARMIQAQASGVNYHD